MALGETNKAEQEVETIMGGTILEFSADKYFDAGKLEGISEGRAEGETLFASLISHLIADGRNDDVAKAANDKAYRDKLFKEYAIA